LQPSEMKNPLAAEHPTNNEVKQDLVDGKKGVAGLG